MPFGKYKDFLDCVRKNKDKSNPQAYCASIEKSITGKWSTENSRGEKVAKDNLPCPGSKIRSKGQGRGLGIGKGKGPIGRKKLMEEGIEVIYHG